MLGSVAYNVSVVVKLFVLPAHPLIDIVPPLGGVVSAGAITKDLHGDQDQEFQNPSYDFTCQ